MDVRRCASIFTFHFRIEDISLNNDWARGILDTLVDHGQKEPQINLLVGEARKVGENDLSETSV